MKLIFTYFHLRQPSSWTKLLFAYIVIMVSPVRAQQLIINEVVSGSSTLVDQYNETPDWVELKNNSSSPICTGAYTIADDLDGAGAWKLPDTCINPGALMIIYLSGNSEDKYHASFSLKRNKEGLYVFENGALSDSAKPVCIPSGYSYGRLQDLSFTHFTSPTPAQPNDVSSSVIINPEKDTLILHTLSGFHSSDISLDLTTFKGTTIYYTLDGNEPDDKSHVYVNGYKLKASEVPGAVSSFIPTGRQWRVPKGEIFTGYALRAVGFSQGCPVTNEVKATFLIDPSARDRYPIDVVSVITDPEGFFSDKSGIYVVGKGEIENYNQKEKKWERDVFLEYLPKGGSVAFKSDAIASIHGRNTRSKPQKSLKLEPAETEAFNYSFFQDRPFSQYAALTLHTADKHKNYGFFKDEMITDIIKDLDLGTMAFIPAVVFLNGEYWGLHSLRERQDEDFVAAHFNVAKENVYLREEPEFYDKDEFSEFINKVRDLDLKTEDAYRFVTDNIDLENFIDYHVAHIYFANTDWPHNNVRVWKDKSSQKFGWLFYDCDVSMNIEDYDAFSKNLNDYADIDPNAMLLTKLLENSTFRSKFYARFLYLLTTTFETSRVLNVIDNFHERYAPFSHEHIARWGIPASVEGWEQVVNKMRSFAIARPGHLITQMVSHFGNPVKVYPNPASETVTIEFMEEEQFQLRLIDARGRELKSSDTSSGTLNISGLDAGIYFIEARYQGLRFTSKLIKY